MPANRVADVESLGVNPQQPFHPQNQVGLGWLHDQMEVMAHQAIGMELPLGLAAGLAQRGQKLLAVFVVPEDVLTLVPTVHHVIHGPRILKLRAPHHIRQTCCSALELKLLVL